MHPSAKEAFKKTFETLKSQGLLLESDPNLPCVTQVIVGRHLHTSWWAHPQANLIYGVLLRLTRNRDVLTAKLVDGKVTLIHKKLWPAFFAVATSREPWQRKGLSRVGKQLFAKVTRRGMLETNRLPGYEQRSKLLADAARELERRLLIYGEGFHTRSGAHAKRLLTWRRWARNVGLARVTVRPEEARSRLENATAKLAGSQDAKKLLPWNRSLD